MADLHTDAPLDVREDTLDVRTGLTVRQLWEWLCDDEVTDDLLHWAPDVAAVTSVLVERSHAYRFVVSPPDGQEWPPGGTAKFGQITTSAAREWRVAMDNDSDRVPAVVRTHWDVVRRHLDSPIADLASGRSWSLCQSVLFLHAIADEASAGMAGGATRSGPGPIFRARARELLTLSGSAARLPAERIARLPKGRTTSVGITHRSVSRYSCSTVDGIATRWDRVTLQDGASPRSGRHANIMLLPWPLQVRESDFIPVPGSVRRPQREPFGFFEYRPSEPLDLDLAGRLIDTAAAEARQVDAVVLPEGAVAEADLTALEALLAQRGVPMLVTGLRCRAPKQGQFPPNMLHVGVRVGATWWHYRQHKHHRWFLDAGQIEAYNIGGALHPDVRWWEAMTIPHRRVRFLELGGGMTVAAVVCEDLARLDGVAQLLRSVGPTLVVTLLLDGPQLAARWTARYAGVLADDPGSTVLTLTALGMADRSRPGGRAPSRAVALWKDDRGLREIVMDPGAQAVLLKATLNVTARHAADGRPPIDDVTQLRLVGVDQISARPATGGASPTPAHVEERPLTARELSVLSGWADAIADAVQYGSCSPAQVIAAADPDASWRRSVLSEGLTRALTCLRQLTEAAWAGNPRGAREFIELVDRAADDQIALTTTVRNVLVAALTQTPARRSGDPVAQ